MATTLALSLALVSSPALAQAPHDQAPTNPTVTEVQPPPINADYLQFGVAFVGEFNLNPGPICPPDAHVPCVMGSGGGVAARAGYRSRGPWYVGGAYEFNRVNTSGLMRLGVLQHLRAEMRYIFNIGLRTEPYFTSGLGLVAFGNEWGLETWGASTYGGVGFELQLSRNTVVGVAFVYRPILIFGWTDRADQSRDTGVAHFIGLDFLVEGREQLGSH